MASREQYQLISRKTAPSYIFSRSFILLLCFASLFLGFSLFRSSIFSFGAPAREETATLKTGDRTAISFNGDCDYSDGQWIYEQRGDSLRYDDTCKEIFKGWNCIASSKSNALDIVNWRWKPHRCELPQFDPLRFLESFRNTNIGMFPLYLLFSFHLLNLHKLFSHTYIYVCICMFSLHVKFGFAFCSIREKKLL